MKEIEEKFLSLFNSRINLRKLKFLLEKGVDPDVKDLHGDAPIHLAIEKNSFEGLKLLLNFKANPDITNKIGDTALLFAAKWGAKSAFIRKLFKAGADVDLINKAGNTPLIEACINGNLSQINVLLSCGSDKHVVNLKNETALSVIMSKIAENRKKSEIFQNDVKTLLEKTYEYEEESDNEPAFEEEDNIATSQYIAIKILNSLLFSQPIYSDHRLKSPEKILDIILSRVKILDDMNRKERVIFYYAVFSGHDSLIKFLLNEKTQLRSIDETSDAFKRTKETISIKNSYFLTEILYNLIDDHSNFLAENLSKEKQAALGILLEFAIEKSDFEIVAYLLKIGANPHLFYKKDSSSLNISDVSLSAFDFTVMTENLNIIHLLKKFDPDTKNVDNFTPTHYICLYGYEGDTRYIIDSQKDLHIQDSLGNTPIHYAIYHPKLLARLLNSLTSNKSSLFIKNNKDQTALSVAESLNLQESVAIFLQYLEEKQESLYLLKPNSEVNFKNAAKYKER